MDPKHISQYINKLDESSLEYNVVDWHATFLGNRLRFYPVMTTLMKLISGQEIYQKKATWPLMKMRLSNFKKLTKEAFYLFLKSVIYKWVNAEPMRRLRREKGSTVVKSFLYKRSFNQDLEYRDIVFGTLLSEFDRREKKYFSLFELESCFKFSLRKPNSTSPLNYLAFISVSDFILCYLDVFFKLFYVRRNYQDQIDNLIQDNFFIESSTANFFHIKLFYYAFKGLVKKNDVARIIYTYENNGWERMLCLASRKYSPKTKLIGHQHVPISPLAINCFTTKNELRLGIAPNKIITTGPRLVDFLADEGGYPRAMLVSGCGVRFNAYPNIEVKKSDLKAPRILVAVDGLYFSSFFINRLLEIDDFIEQNKIEVVIRYHQSINHEGMKSLLISDVLNKKHYTISSTSLEEDFKRNDVILYWGTSVAFEALRYGIALIHCPDKELFSNDPLYGFEDLKWTARTSDELKFILSGLMKMNLTELNNRREQGLNYVIETLTPVSREKLNPFFD
ncbi:MAG: hypothetical protein ACOYL6_02750 [Bacteriovoracaceae bacterium]